MSTRSYAPQVTPKPIIDAAFAFGHTQVLISALELDVFTHIDNGQHTVEKLSHALGASERGLRMLLNVLTALGFLTKQNGRFDLPEVSKTYLSQNGTAYMGGWTQHMAQIQPAWENLTEAVRTGKPPARLEGPEDAGEFFSQFVHTLYALGKPAAEAVAHKVLAQFPKGKGLRVLDIGAGSGVWSFAFAKQNPKVRVTVADWPKVIEKVTSKFAQRDGVSDRVSYLRGDFHQSDFGSNQFDVAIAGHICHGEGAARTRELLARMREALKPDGVVVIADFLPDEQRARDKFPLMFAINMLVHTEEGDTFTWSEYRQWLEEAGFQDMARIEAPGQAVTMVARKRAVTEKAA